jgi:hypothetical protein
MKTCDNLTLSDDDLLATPGEAIEESRVKLLIKFMMMRR